MKPGETSPGQGIAESVGILASVPTALRRHVEVRAVHVVDGALLAGLGKSGQ